MLITSILDQIRRDVASFADPGTEVQISDHTITWTRSRTSFSAQLIRTLTGFPAVSYRGREYTYTGFLASEALADLKDLAATIFSATSAPSYYVPVYAKTEAADPASISVAEASELILKQTLDPAALPLAATRVLFVHGNAGTGKTSTLQHVTKLQAERYLQGQTGTLLLYLDAQGKGLSQLEDVMARALQDLRAKFTYHSVAALARRHCVIPIVDGFDELIGPSSAREAFSNLSQFLAQLDCEGVLIASSRSAFIDYRTLYERAAELAASQNLSYEIIPVEVLPWNNQAIEKYCESRTPGSSDLKRQVFALMGSEAGELVRKPFFLSKICDILNEGGDIDVGRDVTRQVVDAALTREATKLRDQRGTELLTADQHRAFCEALADEMWSLGSPELDGETIRLLAEVMAEQFTLSPRDTKTLVDRSIAHGLLTVVPGRVPEKRSFEHELFRFEFQAGSLGHLLEAGTDAGRDYIQRAELPLDIVSRVPFYGLRDSAIVARVIGSLSRMVAAAPNNQFAATNAGSIAAALVRDREDLSRGMRFFGFYLRSHDLGKCLLQRAEIRKCVFERIDFRQSRFLECAIEDSQFIACTLGTATRWDGTDVEVSSFFGIRAEKANTQQMEIYDPREIATMLRNGGALLPADDLIEGEEQLPAEIQAQVDLVERLLTHARNHFYLSRNDRWFQNNLANNARWEALEPLLRRHRLIEDVSLDKSGRPEKFLRLTTAPDKILQARVGQAENTPPSAVRFWKDLVGRS